MDIIDRTTHPLEDPAFRAASRETYLATGLCALPGFLTAPALAALQAEAQSLAPQAYFTRTTHSVYLDGAGRQEETDVGSVAYDLLPDGPLRTLYADDGLRDFIGHVVGVTPIHRFADPFGACSINVFRAGGAHGWHFDESPFTVTLMLQKPEAGGTFEYAPGLRDDAPAIEALQEGLRDGVVELPFAEGTLLIFAGRQSIHRVTHVQGETPRLVPVLCYAAQPGTTNSPEVREMFWGRA
ncbi:MAG: hypothetical protein AAGI70_06615, partial [Pseudomonadota bacterium]